MTQSLIANMLGVRRKGFSDLQKTYQIMAFLNIAVEASKCRQTNQNNRCVGTIR